MPVPHRHGQAPEVTGPNVAPEDMIFAESTIAEMDAECGTQQERLRVQTSRGGSTQRICCLLHSKIKP